MRMVDWIDREDERMQSARNALRQSGAGKQESHALRDAIRTECAEAKASPVGRASASWMDAIRTECAEAKALVTGRPTGPGRCNPHGMR